MSKEERKETPGELVPEQSFVVYNEHTGEVAHTHEFVSDNGTVDWTVEEMRSIAMEAASSNVGTDSLAVLDVPYAISKEAAATMSVEVDRLKELSRDDDDRRYLALRATQSGPASFPGVDRI